MANPPWSTQKTPLLALPHPTKLRFVWHSRFYTAVLDRDLFEQWTVTRSWGIKKGGQGSGRGAVVESFEAGLTLQ